jgi:hypothetical protein
MNILFLSTIIVLIGFLIYRNDRARQRLSELYTGKNTRLLLLIGLFTLLAFFYPKLNLAIKKLKQKLNT